MRDYSKVAPTFWIGDTGKKIREMGRDCQVIAAYLMTCPNSTMLGLYYLPMPTLCHEVGISHQGASKALRRLSEGGFAHYDAPSEYVWVPEMAHYQVGEPLSENDNRVKGIKNELQSLRKVPFFNNFLDRYRESFHLQDISPSEGPCKPLRSQEQEQEQEQKKEGDASAPPPCPHQEIISLYNEILPELPAVIPHLWNGKREQSLQARWRERKARQDLLWWRKLFEHVHENCPFLLGENDRKWKATLGWMIEKEHFTNILEGKYVRE